MRIVKEAEERRNEILDVAERLFGTKGFDGTSTTDILNEIGIARGTLYYHFKSKEDILDAMIERMTGSLVAKASEIAGKKDVPVLQRLTQMMLALNVNNDLGHEIMEQVHKPQNALMHQKMQERLLAGVNPIVTSLIEEGIAQGICQTDHPAEVAEMTMLYSSTVFDDLAGYSGEERQRKISAFIYNLERLLGMERNSLREVILPIFRYDMLEEMTSFFENRLMGYDEHMITTIEGSAEFYKFTAEQLPTAEYCTILDLGCGTGLELEEYLVLNPSANITGIDLSKGMLSALKNKFPNKTLNLICGSYFDIPFGNEQFDAAVSVESLHHFSSEQKQSLYKRLFDSLKVYGYFILTDYFAESEVLEQEYFENLRQLKLEQGISDNRFYHYDTPLTIGHEMEILKAVGFSRCEILKNWGATYTIKANKFPFNEQSFKA